MPLIFYWRNCRVCASSEGSGETAGGNAGSVGYSLIASAISTINSCACRFGQFGSRLFSELHGFIRISSLAHSSYDASCTLVRLSNICHRANWGSSEH